MTECWRTGIPVLILGLVYFAVLADGQSRGQYPSGQLPAGQLPGQFQSTQEEDSTSPAIKALSTFSLKLTKELLKENNGNVIVEPLGVATLLAQLLQGVARKSTTSHELQDVLGRNVTESREIGQIGRDVQNTRSTTTDVLIGSKLFLADGKKTTQRYKDITSMYFYNTVSNVPFNNPTVAADQINNWASRSTKGNVPSIVTPAALSPDTRLVLANAAYFKGVWASAFTSSQTSPQWFSPGDNAKAVPIWMMHQVSTLPANYDINSGAWWVRLAVNEKHAVVFVLPSRRFGLNEVINRLTVDSINEMARLPIKRTVDLSVPKFSISSSQSVKPALRNMGVRSIFDQQSYLTGILDNNEPLVVSDMLHRAKIEVDEKGVTAAAVSAAVVNTLTLASYSDDIKLVFDQPFLAMIVDTNTGLPIFVARVADPSQKD